MGVLAVADTGQIICCMFYQTLYYVYPYTGALKNYYENIWPYALGLSIAMWCICQFVSVYTLLFMTCVQSSPLPFSFPSSLCLPLSPLPFSC